MANPTTLILSDRSCILDLVASVTATATAAGNNLPGADNYSHAIFFLNVTAASGTTPTLDVYIQTLLPDATNWTDIAAFTQVTGIAKRAMAYVSGGNSEFAVSDATLAAGTFRAFPLGSNIRAKYKIGGTSPSFTFQISGLFIV